MEGGPFSWLVRFCDLAKYFTSYHELSQHTISIGEFKNNLFKYYSQMTQEIYNIDVPQTFKTICVKCHSCRPLSSLSVKMCSH